MRVFSHRATGLTGSAAKPSTLRMKSSQASIGYDDTGGSGPLVIAAAGMGDLRSKYRYLMPYLPAAGYRVVTADVGGHSGLWAATQLRVADWSDASQKLANAYLGLVLAVVRGNGSVGDQATHAARFLRACLRGFIDLELGGSHGLSQDVDESFRSLLHLLDAGLHSLALQ